MIVFKENKNPLSTQKVNAEADVNLFKSVWLSKGLCDFSELTYFKNLHL